MSYHEILQAELKTGKGEIEAADAARVRYQLQQRKQLKGRSVNDAHNPGSFSFA